MPSIMLRAIEARGVGQDSQIRHAEDLMEVCLGRQAAGGLRGPASPKSGERLRADYARGVGWSVGRVAV